ncbi:hypothetical protein ACO1O0_008558 [Amphichorda felina]
MVRVRVVQGSCWPCKKRRTRCDLAKPVCQRCVQTGATCDYSAQLIRWSTRPSVRVVPSLYQVSGLGQDRLAYTERRALDYFHGRVWPLLQTSEDPCPPPLPVALEHRVVLLATCVLAGSHHLLQGGKDRHGINAKRLECLAAIKSEVDGCCAGSRSGSLFILLFAVLLLHLHDGFMEPGVQGASTAIHHQGVAAILVQLGGIEHVLLSAPESLQMLLSEFVSGDLTTAMLQGTLPAYPPSIWHVIDQGAVWWGRDPRNRQSLATVLREMSALAFYHHSIANGEVELCMDEVRAFEEVLRPTYTPLAAHSPGSDSAASDVEVARGVESDDIEAVHAFALIRSFQHTALIFLYRAVCGLPIAHPLVQQHVLSCLNCIFEIERPSKALHCVIFPLCVAGAHAQSSKHRKSVLDMLAFVHDNMRFASVRAVIDALGAMWSSQSDSSWVELFAGLGPHILVL